MALISHVSSVGGEVRSILLGARVGRSGGAPDCVVERRRAARRGATAHVVGRFTCKTPRVTCIVAFHPGKSVQKFLPFLAINSLLSCFPIFLEKTNFVGE